jgi:hypothetical protein
MTIMRPIRTIATALLVASLAMAGCGRSQPNDGATDPSGPPAATAPPITKAPAPGDSTNSPPVVLVDGRHTVYLKTVDPNRRTIRFDLIQFYGGDDAIREAAKDHPDTPANDPWYYAPNGFYIRNVNPKLRTLPVPSNATITVITLAWGEGPADSGRIVPASLSKLAAYMPAGERPFSITVRHGQVVKLAEIFVP